MKSQRSMAQAPEKIDKEKWVKVQVYMPTHTCTGYVYCSHRRLLDVLNGIPSWESIHCDEFLPVNQVEICSPDGKEATVQSAHVNRDNILFIREVGDGQTQGLGSQVGHKPYPYVPKPFVAVKLCMPLYTLIGQMHCTERTSVATVLNSETRFLALTNVEICPSAGKSEAGVSFIAVNKGQIILSAELEPSPVEEVET